MKRKHILSNQLFTLLLVVAFGHAVGHAGDAGYPFSLVDLNRDGHPEQLFQVANVFVGESNFFVETDRKRENRLYIEDGATGELIVFEFEGLNFKVLFSKAKNGNIHPFHDEMPDLLILLDGQLKYFVSYSAQERKFKSYEINITEIKPDQVLVELQAKEKDMSYFSSNYKGDLELFPFHHKKGVVRALHDKGRLNYFMYRERDVRETTWKWYRLDYDMQAGRRIFGGK